MLPVSDNIDYVMLSPSHKPCYLRHPASRADMRRDYVTAIGLRWLVADRRSGNVPQHGRQAERAS